MVNPLVGTGRATLGGGPPPENLLANIKTNLIEWWTLDEASGNRTGSHAAKVLTDNNTVGSAAGKQSNAALFVSANSEHLNIADSADWDADSYFTIAYWCYATSSPGAGALYDVASHDANNKKGWETGIRNQAGTLRGEFTRTTTAGWYTVNATTFGAMSTGTWYFVVCDFDPDTNLAGIRVNAGTRDTVLCAAGSYDPAAIAMSIGSRANGLSNFLNGRVDEFAIWDRLLTDVEITALYNAGSGVTYGDL